MIKHITILLFSFLFSNVIIAQNSEKIKGNKNVITKQTNIESFHTIVLDKDFEIEIIYNKTPSVEIETDENLHEVIKFIVQDSVLTFSKSLRITSKKKLHIRVSYDDFFKHIETTDNAEIKTLTSIDLANISVKTKGSSNVELTIKSENFSFEASDKSKAKLNVTSDVSSINLIGTAKLEALINSAESDISVYQRAVATIEGSSNNTKLELDNNAQFNGKNFTINTCNAVCEISSDAHIEVLKDLTLEISGTSAMYLYEDPKITINRFTDTAKIQKKVKK